MTIRKQWLIILILVAVFSVTVNSFVLSSLTDRYFKDYVKENYEKHYDQIVDYVTKTLSSDDSSINQMAVDLDTHLVDPIIRIKVYDKSGTLIADVHNAQGMGRGMMMGYGMNGMMGRRYNSGLEEVDHAEIIKDNQVIGQVNITKYSSAENSIDTWLFQSSLIKNSFYSIGIVLLFVILIGLIISRKMSKDLIDTADLAQNLDMGNETIILNSKVKEIKMIQQSLESLNTRLKIKQKSRKALIDEMVHQTRTPLTIIKSHLEGLEDGVIEMNPDEIKICENQVENITSIISNMSGIIDSEKLGNVNHCESFELNQLITKIVDGLKVQFEKKNIALIINDNNKINLNTDQYKLSQAIYNILTNSYKYTNSDGEVKISYQIDDIENDIINLTIVDTGIGISKEDQQKIFNAYYRSQNNSNISGEGLGLYIAKENIESLDGTIMVESELGKGSKFIIRIPIYLSN